jgi:hypothetical protein
LAVSLAAFPVPVALRRRLRDWLAPTPIPEAAGHVIGRTLSLLPLVPGIGGAAMISLGTGEFAGHVFGHGLAPWVALAVGGVFALFLDRKIP